MYCVNDIKTLISDPLISYGNHSYSHYVMSSLNECQQELEIKNNLDILRKCNVKMTNIFSLPFGGDEHFNSVTIKLLNKYKYSGFLKTGNALKISKYKNRYTLLPSRDRYLVKSSFNSFQKHILTLGLKGVLKINYNKKI